MRESTFFRTIEIAMENDELYKFIVGYGSYGIPLDPRDSRGETNVKANIGYYHSYAEKNPELHLDEKFVQEIERALNERRPENIFMLFLVYKSMMAEKEYETTSDKAFVVSEQDTRRIFERLSKDIAASKEAMTKWKDSETSRFSDGMYGYIVDENQRFEESTGMRFM